MAAVMRCLCNDFLHHPMMTLSFHKMGCETVARSEKPYISLGHILSLYGILSRPHAVGERQMQLFTS